MTSTHICAPAAMARARAGMLVFAFAGLLLAVAPAPVSAQDPDPVAARVNGFEIRQSDLALAEEEFGDTVPGNTSADRRDALITTYADMILAARAAEAKGMGSTVQFSRKLAFAKTKLLMEALLTAEAKAVVTEDALRKVYDQAAKQIGKDEEVHARHILVESEDEAKAVLAELKQGADFEKLAKAKSKDPSAAENGGDLGYFTKQQMVPEFAETAFKLSKGQLSEPVKTRFGWHIIRTEDKRTRQPPEFDKVRPELAQYLTRKAHTDLIVKLRESAKIEKLPPPAEKK